MHWTKIIRHEVTHKNNIGRVCVVCPDYNTKQITTDFLRNEGFDKYDVVVVYGKLEVVAQTFIYINQRNRGRGIVNRRVIVDFDERIPPKKDPNITIDDLNTLFTDDLGIYNTTYIF